jgi:DNA replication protein DnaC
MELTHQLTPMLRTLRLSGILETLEVRNRQAVESRSSFVEFLALLLQDEVERRGQSALRLRLRRAMLDPSKTLEAFDFGFNPKLNKAQVFDLATCQFVERHENVLIYGPTGTGKSHLCQALAHEACRRGYEVLFVSAAKMLTHLGGGRADGTTATRLAKYLRPDVLALDDFGLKALRPPAPEDLYDIIHERYEKASIVLTSNRDRAEWPELFGEPLLASAALDRLTHRAHFLEVMGPSYRAEQTKQQLAAQRRGKAAPKGEAHTE